MGAEEIKANPRHPLAIWRKPLWACIASSNNRSSKQHPALDASNTMMYIQPDPVAAPNLPALISLVTCSCSSVAPSTQLHCPARRCCAGAVRRLTTLANAWLRPWCCSGGRRCYSRSFHQTCFVFLSM
jgi:hypothetical protein